MAGGFAVFTDENINGRIVRALRQAGWDVTHAAETFGERTKDLSLFEYAARAQRVLVTTDRDHLVIAREWLETHRTFRMLFWSQVKMRRVAVSLVVAAFEELAAKPDAFASGIEYLRLPQQ